MNPRLLLGGLKSYLPIRPSNYKGTGGTTTGQYCYSVWLRHLSLIARHTGLLRPRVLVEIGPGDTIGLGLAALLSGTERYIGLDVLEHASVAANTRVLDELVELYRTRAPIPGDRDFPRLYPKLSSYAFPASLIDEGILIERTSDAYVDQLRSLLTRLSHGGEQIEYICPWTAPSVAVESADLVISQVALESMDSTERKQDLRRNLAAMAKWLRPGGVMSHQVDFSCPGGVEWNHHWSYGDLSWAIVRGKRPYYANRAPLSEYLRLCEEVGCRVVGVERVLRDGIPRNRMAARFRDLPEEDLHTSAALIIAVKQ
jgi:hypothetical protein